MLPFAQFLEGFRQRRDLSVAALATASGLEAYTVSEILGSRAPVRVCEAIALCRALGLRCGEVFQILTGQRLADRPEGADALSQADVEIFDRLYQRRRDVAVAFLRDMLLAPLAQGRGAMLDPALITDLALRDDGIVRLDLGYPSELQPAAIRRIAIAEGVILAEDIAAYARQITLPGPPTAKNRRLRETLQRLYHTPLALIKLPTLLELDTSLPQRGMLFRMAWQLWPEPPAHIRLFILACRWHERPGSAWLAQARAMLEMTKTSQ